MKAILPFLTLLFAASAMKPPRTGKEILTQMHARYAGKWYSTFRFSQTTERYRNDSLVDSQTWYENIRFPGNFRIDFGNADSGNAVIFRDDSSYVFRNSKKVRTSYYPNDLLFLLGGMYFYPIDESLSKMTSFGFDINKCHEDTWKGRGVYVIGSSGNQDASSQVWFDKENFSLVRMIRYEKERTEEAVLDNHVKLHGGFSETLVHFYINGKLVQVEKYHDLQADIAIDPRIFDPSDFVKNK